MSPELFKRFAERELPTLSPDTGLIGYPKYSQYGVIVQSLFRPDITLWEQININGTIPSGWDIDDKVKNSTHNNAQNKILNQNKHGQKIWTRNAPWDGIWLPHRITHEISSEKPDGLWRTEAECVLSNFGDHYTPPQKQKTQGET